MKKSELYRIAQYSVLNASGLANPSKVEILRELMQKEDIYLYEEKQESEKK